MGRWRGSSSDRYLAVCCGCGHFAVLYQKVSSSTYQKGEQALESQYFKRTAGAVVIDMPTAVCHEFWHSDGTGTRQQLWPCGDGSVCGGSQD